MYLKLSYFLNERHPLRHNFICLMQIAGLFNKKKLCLCIFIKLTYCFQESVEMTCKKTRKDFSMHADSFLSFTRGTCWETGNVDIFAAIRCRSHATTACDFRLQVTSILDMAWTTIGDFVILKRLNIPAHCLFCLIS